MSPVAPQKTMEAQVKAIREPPRRVAEGAELLARRADEEEAKSDTEKSWKDELDKHAASTERLDVELLNAQQAAELCARRRTRTPGFGEAGRNGDPVSQRGAVAAGGAAARKSESTLREAKADKRLLDQRYKTALGQHDRTMKDLQEQLDLNATNQSAALAEIAQREEEYDLAHTDAHRKLALAQSRREQAEQQAKLNMRDAYDPKVVERIARGKDSPSNRLVVKAAEAGTVAKLLVRSPGETVQRGQPLMMIVPSGTLLYAEIRIPNRDIGQIKSGQDVHLKLDAFPFADYDTIKAKLGSPEDPEVLRRREESHYRVHATLDPKYGNPQEIRPANRPDAEGKVLRLSMTGVAEVVTEQKTILELILKPFRELTKSR
jgi:multidrug efflux pump subunit AcrA (membrane-fusion protein)